MSSLKHYLAAYEATIYTGSVETDVPEYVEHGFISCDNYVDAMKQIEEYYGDDIIDIKITLYDGAMLTVSKALYSAIVDEMGGR